MPMQFGAARIAWALVLLSCVCLVMAVGSSSAQANYAAGQQALEGGKPEMAAAEWRAGAQSGDRQSMLALGRLYVQGLGVAQDFVEAHKWFNLAASRGVAEAATERDAVAEKMTPVQVARAQEQAKVWRPGAGQAASAVAESATPSPAGQRAPAEIEDALKLGVADRRSIQAGLAALGFQPGPADGMFGRKTRAALAAWQAVKGKAATGYLTHAEAETLKATGQEVRRSKAETERKAREAAEARENDSDKRLSKKKTQASNCPDLTGSFSLTNKYGKFRRTIKSELTTDSSVYNMVYQFEDHPPVRWHVIVGKIVERRGAKPIEYTAKCDKGKLQIREFHNYDADSWAIDHPYTRYVDFEIDGNNLLVRARSIYDQRDDLRPTALSRVYGRLE